MASLVFFSAYGEDAIIWVIIFVSTSRLTFHAMWKNPRKT